MGSHRMHEMPMSMGPLMPISYSGGRTHSKLITVMTMESVLRGVEHTLHSSDRASCGISPRCIPIKQHRGIGLPKRGGSQ
jgi:hypothetical protein